MTNKTTETKIRNSEKAARLLHTFYTGDCSGVEVIVYFRDNSAQRIVDRSINVTPEMARYWKYSNWLYFVESAEECYRDISQLSLDEVASVVIRFKMTPGSLGVYSVENTDLSKVEGFDRFLSINPRTGKNYEMFFNRDDRANIRNAHIALHKAFTSSDLTNRMAEVASDLPYVCLHGNGS